MNKRVTTDIADFDNIPILAFDTETFDLELEKSLFSEGHTRFELDIFSVAGYTDKELIVGAFPKDKFNSFWRYNSHKTLIIHNAAYDINVLRVLGIDLCKIKFEDTYIMAKLLNEHRKGGLKYLREVVLCKEGRDSYLDVDTKNTEEYYKYC